MRAASGSRSLPFAGLLLFGLIAHLLIARSLWLHESDAALLLGRYSTGYGLAVITHAVATVAWAGALIVRHPLEHGLRRLPSLLIVASVIVLTLAAAAIWQLNIEEQLRAYASLLVLALILPLLAVLPDAPARPWRWWGLLLAVALLLLVPMAVTLLSRGTYSPDEAHWADYATSPYVAGGLYARTWLDAPAVIKPGLGWSVAAYGWLLQNLDFSLHTLRAASLVWKALILAGMVLVANRLYGRRVAVVAGLVTFFSVNLSGLYQFRPDHQLPLAFLLLLFALNEARQRSRRAPWDLIVGLLATLSMQLHAGALTFAVGFSFYYAAALVHGWLRHRDQRGLLPALAFGLGALLGTGLHYVFNIAPVGGLESYVSTLSTERVSSFFVRFAFFSGPSLLELILMVSALGFLVWRRRDADRLLLGLLLCMVAATLLFDTWGYNTVYQALYLMALAAALAEIFPSQLSSRHNRRGLMAQSALLVILIGQLLGTQVSWTDLRHWLNTGQLTPVSDVLVGQSLLERMRPDDVIVSHHILIWTFHDNPDFYSVSAEVTAQRRWDLADPADVWERVSPTVIVEVHRRVVLPPGLQAYMARHDFVACETYTVPRTPLDVTLYRPDCEV